MTKVSKASQNIRIIRALQTYGDVVMGVQASDDYEEEPFDVVLGQLKREVGAENDVDLTARQVQAEAFVGTEFPQDVYTPA
jgi:pyruvate,orthophosphate dikinase